VNISNDSLSLLDEFLTQCDAAKAINKHPRTLKRWEDRGCGPPVTYIGRTPYYHIPALKRWIAEQERSPRRPDAPRRGRPRKNLLRTKHAAQGDAAPPLAARSQE
jgi:hypothetical protein